MKLIEAFLLAGVVGLGASACKEPADGDGDGGADSATDGGPGDDSADSMMDDGGETGPLDCIPGGLGCVCAEGVCSGVLFCVEDMCVQGPAVEFDDDYPDVLAGLRIPVDVDAEGESIVWSQAGGPTVNLLATAGPEIQVDIPPDTPDGATFTLQVDVTLNGVTLNDTLDITIREAVFSNMFPDVTDPTQLGTTDGLAFNATGMWVVSQEGFVSQMSPGNEDEDPPVPPGFVQSYDVGGLPAGANFLDNERLVIANTMLSEVQVLQTNSGNVNTYFGSIDGGGTLGAVSYPLADDNDGDVLVTNALDGQLIYYDTGDPDDDEPIPPSVFVLAEGLGTNPSALAFGPEGRGLVYVGVEDAILRVPYEDGMIGMVGTYLDLAGMCGEPDGIAFDEGQNMWVGCPATNTLVVARYVGDIAESTTVIRSWSDVGTGISRFANLEFGGGDFPGRSIYWTNLEDGTVGVLGVGLRRGDN